MCRIFRAKVEYFSAITSSHWNELAISGCALQAPPQVAQTLLPNSRSVC